MKLNAEQITIFLVSISLMLFIARLFGEILIKIKQPAIIGEILAGIILGPTVFGSLAPFLYDKIFPKIPELTIALDGITTLAIIMLMLVLGLEVDLSVILKNSKTALYTSLLGMFFPFLLGVALAYFAPDFIGQVDRRNNLALILFMGTAMSISALPVIAKTLMDLNILKTDIGLVVIASAMFGDLAGWIIFSIILGMMGKGTHVMGIGGTILIIFIFLAVMLIIVRKLNNKIFPLVMKHFSFPGGVLNYIFISGFICAALTETMGIHAIFGAFILGIALGDTAYLKEDLREMIQQFVTNIFAPLFFVSIGLRINFLSSFDLPLVAVIMILAFIGKVVGSGLGAYLGGMSKNDSLAVGFGMNSRGAMEIILGLLALQSGLINEKIFVALVVMALVTSLTSAPIMNLFVRFGKKFTLSELLNPRLIYFSDKRKKEDQIVELVYMVSKRHKINVGEVLNEVLKREELLPTGIQNYLAIPHAKVKISKPIVAVAINKNGLDFEAADQLPAKIIILLLTPKDNHEIQLQLLADISRLFKDRGKIEELLRRNTTREFIDFVNAEITVGIS